MKGDEGGGGLGHIKTTPTIQLRKQCSHLGVFRRNHTNQQNIIPTPPTHHSIRNTLSDDDDDDDKRIYLHLMFLCTYETRSLQNSTRNLYTLSRNDRKA